MGMSANKLPSVQREHQQLGDLAHSAIRDAIVDGRLQMGERLVEAHLAEELGVSRGPVREALRRLASEGLVLERPHYGTFVTELSASDLVDVYNARIALETMAVRLAVRRGMDAAPLRAAMHAMQVAAKANDAEAVVAAEVRFHEEMCRVSGNRFIQQVFQVLEGHIRLALSVDDSTFGSLADIVAEHEALLDLLVDGDEESAPQAMHHHIVSTVGEAIGRMGGDAGDLVPAASAPPGH